MLYRVEFIFNRPPTYCFILEATGPEDARRQGLALAMRDRIPRWNRIEVCEVACRPITESML